MPKILLFAGTSEGRELAERLSQCGVRLFVSVATEYGELLLHRAHVPVLRGRKDAQEIRAFLLAHPVDCVVDATHPYAALATENIRSACRETGTAYLRLLREDSTDGWRGNCLYVPDAQSAAEALLLLPGNVLLTTGSKELSVFARVPDYAERIFVRMLPTQEAVHLAGALGFAPGHLICMQGPFSEELNLALLHQFHIRVLVTKESGKAGGFWEKLRAAERADARTVVIGRPPQVPGYSFDALWRELCDRFHLESTGEAAASVAEKG